MSYFGCRAIAAAIAVTATCGVLAACGSSSDDDGSTSAGTGAATAGIAVPDELKSGLDVGMDVSYPPLEYYEQGDKLTGIDVEVAQAIADRLGVPLKVQNIGFDSLITSLAGGRVDMLISGMKDTPQRHQKINMIDYFQTSLALLVPKGNPKGITSLETLCGHTAGQVTGTVTKTAVEEASKRCANGSIKVLGFGSNADVNVALKAGRVDANLEDFVSLSYVARTSGGGNDYEAIPQKDLGTEYMGLGTLKSNPEVTDAVVAAYKAILADGTLARIYEKYGYPDSVPSGFIQNAGKD